MLSLRKVQSYTVELAKKRKRKRRRKVVETTVLQVEWPLSSLILIQSCSMMMTLLKVFVFSFNRLAA